MSESPVRYRILILFNLPIRSILTTITCMVVRDRPNLFRRSSLSTWLLSAWVAISGLMISGCSENAAGPDGQKRRAASGEEMGQDTAAERVPPTADESSQALDGEELPGVEAKNPLIRGLSQLLEASPVIEDESNDLQQGLSQADSILSQIKEENRQALRDLNRQIPLGPQRSPNILILVADDLGYGDLGVYGQQVIETPNLDALASEGMHFAQFYAGGISSAASQWCLLTGCDTSRVRKEHRVSYALDAEALTLGEVMWRAGYETVFVGAWLATNRVTNDMPHLHGFDRWLGVLGSTATTAYPASVWSDGAEIRLRGNSGGRQEVFLQDVYTEEIIGFLKNRPRQRPFLLVAFFPTPRLTRDFAGNALDDLDWTAEEKARAAAIAGLDNDVGRLMQTLKDVGLDRQTVVVLTSDNGPSPLSAEGPDRFASTGRLRGRAGDLYEGGLRVPLIIRWPGQIAAGATTNAPAAIWDLLATCAELGGAIRRPTTGDGVSLVPVFRGRQMPARGMLYWDTYEPAFGQAVRQGEWKVVRPCGKMQLDDVELYNLSEDPTESRNVARENPEILSQFIKG